jgi:hypothetical protein
MTGLSCSSHVQLPTPSTPVRVAPLVKGNPKNTAKSLGLEKSGSDGMDAKQRAEVKENLESQGDELAALEAIYEGDLLYDRDEQGHLTSLVVRVPTGDPSIDNDIHLERLSFRVHLPLPAFYPSREPPSFTVFANWLHDESVATLREAMLGTFHSEIGEPVLFKWVSFLQSTVGPQVPRRQLPSHLVQPKASVNSCAKEASSLSAELNAKLCTDEEVNDDSETSPENPDESRESASAYRRPLVALSAIPLPEIKHGEPIVDRKSKFTAHLARITTRCCIFTYEKN